MIKIVFVSILLLSVIFMFSSCGCSCQCDKNLGCTILKLINASGTVIMTKTFCSQTDYYHDLILRDSVNAFYSRYDSTRTRTDERDSIYKYESVREIKCKDTEPFEKQGFGCYCAK